MFKDCKINKSFIFTYRLYNMLKKNVYILKIYSIYSPRGKESIQFFRFILLNFKIEFYYLQTFGYIIDYFFKN